MKHSEVLKFITKRLGKTPTQSEFAEILGKPRGTINSRASRDLKYDYEELKKIGNYYGIDFFNDDLEDVKQDILNKRFDYLDKKNEIVADYYPDVFGSCGNGIFELSQIKEPITVPKRLINGYSKGKKYSVINAYGDSMMPYIHDKDMLVVEHYEGEQIRDNRIYVFRFGDKIFVKRLVLNINQLVIKSDNTFYQPITVELSENTDFQIIGQIVGLMRSAV